MTVRRKGTTVGDSETFVTLMRVAQEDPEVRKTLAAILELKSFHRKSLLNTLVQRMKMQGAPTDFVFAVGALLDDDVAKKANELINK